MGLCVISVCRGSVGNPYRAGGWSFRCACLSFAAAACNLYTEDQRREPDVFDKIRSVDLLPRFPAPTGTKQTGVGQPTGPQTYLGESGAQVRDLSNVVGAQPAAGGEGYELNFENTPVTGVAKVVLGDILQVGYLIDPRVQGTITLASGRPVPKGDLLYVLESALRISGASLVKDKRGYIILPATDAVGSGTVDTAARGEPGFGITVIPLQYVSATTLGKLLDSFAVKPGSVRVDPQRNFVVVQGSGADRRNAAETVLSFDADWMRGQSVGIYPVRNSMPELIISELDKIMDSGEGGLSQSLVKLQPIARLNAVMVISSKPALLRTAATWITRLDKSDTAATGVKVYQVRYGDARLLAAAPQRHFRRWWRRPRSRRQRHQSDCAGLGRGGQHDHDGSAERLAAARRAQCAGWVVGRIRG